MNEIARALGFNLLSSLTAGRQRRLVRGDPDRIGDAAGERVVAGRRLVPADRIVSWSSAGSA
ncbi:MAG: hypothetical protein QM582_01895 [Micropruina sp.]|uniref:hypothetical protein n=1 Tax=Micropruina sp. TaxID=2737536 RepID=UPI0039E51EAC